MNLEDTTIGADDAKRPIGRSRRAFSVRGEEPTFCQLGLTSFQHRLYLSVDRLWQNLLLHQCIATLLGAAIDDLLRVGIADARKGLQIRPAKPS